MTFTWMEVSSAPAVNGTAGNMTIDKTAPRPVVRALTQEEIDASNTKGPNKAGKRIRNNSRFEGDSKIQILKINTLDEATQKRSKFFFFLKTLFTDFKAKYNKNILFCFAVPHPGQKVRPAEGKQKIPVFHQILNV